jgi:hypothetical protein
MYLAGDHLVATSARAGAVSLKWSLGGAFVDWENYMENEKLDSSWDNVEDYVRPTFFGRAFLEKLLLAIINAHPVGQDTPETRLKIALRALTGENSKAEIVRQDSDLPALQYMAQEHHRDKGNRFLLFMKQRKEEAPFDLPKIRKDLALAKEATDKFFNPPNEQVRKSIYDRLREKFSGTYYTKHGKGHGVNFRESFVYMAVEHDYVAETVEAQNLDLICAILRKHGVKVER